MRPKITVYRPADTHPRIGFNRYPGVVIGAYAVFCRRCWGLQWRRP